MALIFTYIYQQLLYLLFTMPRHGNSIKTLPNFSNLFQTFCIHPLIFFFFLGIRTLLKQKEEQQQLIIMNCGCLLWLVTCDIILWKLTTHHHGLAFNSQTTYKNRTNLSWIRMNKKKLCDKKTRKRLHQKRFSSIMGACGFVIMHVHNNI